MSSRMSRIRAMMPRMPPPMATLARNSTTAMITIKTSSPQSMGGLLSGWGWLVHTRAHAVRTCRPLRGRRAARGPRGPPSGRVPIAVKRRTSSFPRAMDGTPNLTLDQLRNAVQAEQIDTVLLVLTDMQGRLQGKRLTARHFLDEVVEHGAEACNYLLAVDVDMNTVSGYAISSWERGYGDFEMAPDLSSLRRVPWHEATALCLADLRWLDGTPVAPSPRAVLQRQLARLAERGLTAYAGTELEFVVYRDTYEEAFAKGYRDLSPANLWNLDYSLLGTARVEPLIRRIRKEMTAAGLVVESSKGECHDGQHEINFRYSTALAAADDHVIYKTGAKEIAAQEGMAITFMAKLDEREGSSCHIHLSLRR